MKVWWTHPSGKKVAAGGIVFYDNEGMWLIKEKKWTDPGGKFRFEDCDIYGTIAREFSEEVYYTWQLTKKDVEHFTKEFGLWLLTKEDDTTTFLYYACIFVPVGAFELVTGEKFSTEKFNKVRDSLVEKNDWVPKHYYSTTCFEKIKYDQLDKLSKTFRLNKMVLPKFEKLELIKK